MPDKASKISKGKQMSRCGVILQNKMDKTNG